MMLHVLIEWLMGLGASRELADGFGRALMFVPIVVLSVLANAIAKRVIIKLLARLVAETKTTWDDALLRREVFNRLSHLAPAVVFYLLAPLALEGNPKVLAIIVAGVNLYAIVVVVRVANALLSAGMDIYDTFDVADQIPIKGFVQVARFIVYAMGGLVFLSVILDKTPLILLSGLGAFTAVLMLVFRDAILGFVAGIQLSTNRMVARGDWIEMPKYQADGDVIEVSLTTVKVQNWDKTITTIPTYALISESFKNWRGMTEAKGRRIKRSVSIDMSSIRFCDEEMLERFAKIEHISEYIQAKKDEIKTYNGGHDVDDSSLANGRRLTNVGTFRAYVLAYLRHNPKLHQDMTFLVRQLAPTEVGLPLEIYVFSNDIAWANYESIQADIFDHILAVASEFDLRVFQNPAGSDLRALRAEYSYSFKN